MRRPRKGDIAQISFWDHAEDSDEGPIKCVVWGYVASAKGSFYKIQSWRLPNDPEANEDNKKEFTILKKVVIDAITLAPKGENHVNPPRNEKEPVQAN